MPVLVTVPVWEELEVLCRKLLFRFLGPYRMLWRLHGSVSLSQLVLSVFRVAAGLGDGTA